MRHVVKMRVLLRSIVGLTAALVVLSWPAPSTATQTQSVFPFGAAGYFGSVIDGRLRVKAGLASREALKQNSRVLIYQDAHAFTPRAARTTFSAASFIP